MTTPLDPYAAASSSLPSAVQNQIPGSIIGANNQTINTSELNLSSSGGGAVLGYAGTPGAGNLTFSLSSASGPDSFGNTVNTGLMVGSGSLVGVSLTGVQMDSTSTLQGTQLNGPNLLSPTVAGGTAASLVHTMTNGAGGVLGYTSGTASTTFATNGNYLWTCPTGITSAFIQCWGAGGGGGGGGSQGGSSGGGGEYAAEPNFTVVPGAVYAIIVGQGGQGGSTNNSGNDGGQTVFQNQQGGGSSVTANPGLGGVGGFGGSGGSGSSNTVDFIGGDGVDASGNTGGGGGGSSGDAAGEGNTGNQSVGSSGASGAAAVGTGGAGGAGGNNVSNGSNGGSPGGGGGGAGANTVVSASKTYTPSGGTYAYRGADATTSPNGLLNHDGVMYQGFPNKTYGTQYSYWILPYAQIQSDMAGLNITSVSMRIKCLFAYYTSGVFAHVWYTSLSSFGNSGNKDAGSPVLVKNFSIKENATVTQSFGLNGSIGTALQSGAAKSIQFNSWPAGQPNGLFPAGDYYGTFDSGANNGVDPELIIYYNNGGGSTAGTGGDGQCIISYSSGTVPTFQLSVSATTAADVYGNPFNPGFTSNQLTVLGSQAPSTTPTAINNTSPTSAAVASNTAGQILTTNANGFTGTMPANQADVQTNAQTGTAASSLSKAYNIPAGDPQVGTVYRLTAWGDFHTPASGNAALSWQVNFGGSAATVTLGGAAMQSSVFYEWFATCIAQCTTNGSGGNITAWVSVNASTFNINEQFTVDTYGLCGASSNNARSTLTANTMQLMSVYASVQSAQTVRCFGSMLERLGP